MRKKARAREQKTEILYAQVAARNFLFVLARATDRDEHTEVDTKIFVGDVWAAVRVCVCVIRD